MVYPFLFIAVFWPMAGMPMSTLIPAFCIVQLNIQVCSAMSVLISAICLDQEKAVIAAIIVMVFLMSAGGYFADMRKLPWWIGWVRFLSNYYYTFGSYMRLTIE